MGLILIPFLLGALWLTGVSIVKTIKLLRRKEIGGKEVGLAFLLSAVIFGLICLSYIVAGRAWGLSPAMRIPTCMFFLPYALYRLSQRLPWPLLRKVGQVALISVGISGLAGIATHDLFLALVSHLGVQEYY